MTDRPALPRILLPPRRWRSIAACVLVCSLALDVAMLWLEFSRPAQRPLMVVLIALPAFIVLAAVLYEKSKH